MSERQSFNYAIVRVVPHAEREEFMNVGVIVCHQAGNFLGAEFAVDEARLKSFAPDLDLGEVRSHLEAIRSICAGGEAAGPIGSMPRRARFDWLVAPRSTIIRTSDVHTGLGDDPQAVLQRLLTQMVRAPEGTDQAGQTP